MTKKPLTREEMVKMARHAATYGIGATRLAEHLNTDQQRFTRKNAKRLIQQFKSNFPKLTKSNP